MYFEIKDDNNDRGNAGYDFTASNTSRDTMHTTSFQISMQCLNLKKLINILDVLMECERKSSPWVTIKWWFSDSTKYSVFKSPTSLCDYRVKTYNFEIQVSLYL